MRDIISDFFDSQLSSILGLTALAAVIIFGLSGIIVGCQNASVACVEAGGTFDDGSLTCEQS